MINLKYLVFFLNALVLSGFAGLKAQDIDKQPNIIFLLADDHRADALGCLGNNIIQTPHMDRMASEGVLFENAFVTTSICSSSRASILTGQYTRRHQITDFKTGLSPESFQNTYPALLKKAGYRIGFIGKYGVGHDMPAEAFDYWKGIPGQPHYEHTDSLGKYKHLTELMGDQSIEFIKSSTVNQPFCLSVSFKAPHSEGAHTPRQFIYNPKYRDMYEKDSIPLPETYAGYSNFPDSFQALPPDFKKQNEARKRWYSRFPNHVQYEITVKSYYRLITGIDEVVGRIRETLKEMNLSENTIIIYTSDNGFYLGEHGLAGKWYGHEESIRIPLIIYDPRQPTDKQGVVNNEMVLNIDMAPSMLSMAGISKPLAMQGESIYELIRGKAHDWRQHFFYEHYLDLSAVYIPTTEGVITSKYKYMKYFPGKEERAVIYEEFFNLTHDPKERNNLHENPEFRSKMDSVKSIFETVKMNAH